MVVISSEFDRREPSGDRAVHQVARSPRRFSFGSRAITSASGGTVRRDNGRVLVRVGDGTLIPAATSPSDDTEVMVGLRPQDCVTTGTADIHGEVAVFEDFLEFGEAVVKVPGVDHTIVVQTPAEQRFRPGDNIAISAAGRAHLPVRQDDWGPTAMTHLFNDPTTFMEDALAGFLDANSRYVAGVPGGVVRATETPPGKVAVIVGGGSGHYPAFCGVVGPGFADGAVVGNIFTSPSTDDAYNVGKAADNGGGVLFSTGNYAGDVMNFDLAQDRLKAEGIDTRNIYVTDDVASAPVEELHKRRGIAGDFVVFKVAGAAADAGYSLDEVERVGRLANDRTRTMGVGLNGCTMPGADDQLFHVPKGKMGVGLGIHGEPGIAEEDLPPAAEIGEMLLDRVLAEEPADSSKRVGAILNGLGATKYEELFVVWKTVSALLRDRGYTVVDPEVGELVTSLDMAGISLTLVYLDEELEKFWTAPADTPAYRKGGSVAVAGDTGRKRDTSAAFAAASEVAEGSEASRRAAAVAVEALAAMEVAIREAESELARIDAIAGDGDHGRGMVKGVTNALEAARPVLEVRRRGRRGARRGRRRLGGQGRRHLRGAVGPGPARDGCVPRRRRGRDLRRRAGRGRADRRGHHAAAGQGRAGRQDHAGRAVPVRRRPGAGPGRRILAGHRLDRGRRRGHLRGRRHRRPASEDRPGPAVGRAQRGYPGPGGDVAGHVHPRGRSAVRPAGEGEGLISDGLRVVVGSDDAGLDYMELLRPA